MKQVITGILQTCCCIDMCKSLQIPGVMNPTRHLVEKWLGNGTYTFPVCLESIRATGVSCTQCNNFAHLRVCGI
jgi:hypothetical protein